LLTEDALRFHNLRFQSDENPRYQENLALTLGNGSLAKETMPGKSCTIQESTPSDNWPYLVQTFEDWAAPSICSYDLDDPRLQEKLNDSVIGVDASYYLDLRLNKTSHEPLLHALGGFPYSLRKILEDDIQLLKAFKIKLLFVFDGLDFRNKEPPSSRSAANRRAHEDGWKHYSDRDPDQTLADFSRAGKKRESSSSNKTSTETQPSLSC
jgi:hypothetical protein